MPWKIIASGKMEISAVGGLIVLVLLATTAMIVRQTQKIKRCSSDLKADQDTVVGGRDHQSSSSRLLRHEIRDGHDEPDILVLEQRFGQMKVGTGGKRKWNEFHSN